MNCAAPSHRPGLSTPTRPTCSPLSSLYPSATSYRPLSLMHLNTPSGPSPLSSCCSSRSPRLDTQPVGSIAWLASTCTFYLRFSFPKPRTLQRNEDPATPLPPTPPMPVRMQRIFPGPFYFLPPTCLSHDHYRVTVKVSSATLEPLMFSSLGSSRHPSFQSGLPPPVYHPVRAL